jgi:photosystem II stability/assembly factor-like uncharacterized protein
MKNSRWFFSLVLFLYLGSDAEAQVTNLTVNGVSSNFSLVQGDSLWWEYNLPIGGTADGQIWIDLNSNGTIDPLTDKQIFGDFTQTDGQYGGNGPGDMDSTVNGHIFCGGGNLGFAPAHYIFTNNNISQSVWGTVIPMPAPAFTVSGTVTPPPQINPQNILVSAGGAWMALTNASGNYTMNFNSSVSGAQMRISVWDKFPPYVVRDTTLTMTVSYTGINFVFARPAAQIVGYLRGEDNYILSNVEIRCYPRQGSGSSKYSTTDASGFFQFGFLLSEINSAPLWGLQASSNGVAPAYFPPYSGSISLHQYDSLRIDLTAVIANDSITGRITVNGDPPNNRSFRIYARTSNDSGQTETSTHPTTGNFTLHVTRNIYNYYPGLNNLPSEYGYDWSNVLMHPGNTNIVLNVQSIAWLPQTSNTSNSLRSISFVNSSTGWVAGANGTVLATTNAGSTWSSQTTNTSNTINGICFINSSTGWFVGDGGIIKKTTNGGANWLSQNSTTLLDLKAVQFLDANIGWVVGGSSTSSGIVLKTTNAGTTWSPSPGYLDRLLAIYMVNASIGWAGGYSGILRTTDGGSTWDPQSGGIPPVYSVHFADLNSGWASGEYHECIHTTNGGANWETQSVGQQHGLRSVFCINSSTAWIAASNGCIYRTTNGGATWTRQLANTWNQLYAVRFVDANNGWVVGDNGTILRTTSGGSAVSVRDNQPTTAPSDFALSQNYPNPFNPTTTIRFELPKESHVTLRIYNMLGQQVMNVVDDRRAAGKYELRIDASHLASGVYFYRLLAGDFSSMKKLILLK